TRALHTLYADSGLRSTDQLNVSILQGRCAGGGSTVNWMVMLRTPQHVIEEWQRQHGTEYMDVRSMSAAFDDFERASHVAPVAAHAHSPINRLILDSARRLGWRARSASVNARDCMRTGACGLGCRYDAKQSTVLTQLPRALHAGARLYCDVSTQRIERSGRSFRVHGRTPAGKTVTVSCDVAVVAAGAVTTPTLLQRSGLAPAGAGSHLRLHPTSAVVGLYDEPFYAASGIPLTAYCDEFMKLHDGYGHWIEAPPLTAGLAAVAMPGFGAAHHAFMQRFPYLAPLIVLVRDGAPDGASVGSVRARGADARIRFRLGRTDRETLLHGITSAARMHFSAGARSVLTLHAHQTLLRSEADLPLIAEASRRYGDPALFSAHVNGTCRIGRNLRTSGCQPDGQVHGQPNLYVMDGSLLPTAPGVNPHETIAATVAILARQLAGTARSQRSATAP
ncbi:MAG TPA: GMC family oxidoreductase N-terminal domain-containing protein, partial [Longimicrobiales bacterium]